MLRSSQLNRREKAGVFLVLVATGVSLLLNASARQATGIALLGIAATWLVGSVNLRTLRAISALACLAALGILIPVAWSDWRAYREWTRSLAGLPAGVVPVGADSDGSRSGFRADSDHHSELIPITVPG